ncbi:hypothetical protein FWD07_02715 [Candidatus Saccharibacteria bacterium]|nr:hypothetical protein [Candidatus Saccharibacteria bacterium]
MLGHLKSLRTNENILVAVDTLLHSKSVFVSVFLMTYMIRTSLTDSPDGFIIFRLVSYIVMGAASIFLMRFLRKHPLAAWRIGTFSSILKIGLVILLDPYSITFPLIIALINGLEATLYWRPTVFFSITEVRNDRRHRFESLKHIFSSIVRIISPIILALLITDAGFAQTSIVIIIISIVQFFITILFRPARVVTTRPHKLRAIWNQFIRIKDLRRNILLMQFVRGLLISGSAYLLVPIILIYTYSQSDIALGIYTSIGVIFAITLTFTYQRIARSPKRIRSFAKLIAPFAILAPLLLVLSPSTPFAVIFYIFSIAAVEGFFNLFASVHIMNSIKKHLNGDSYLLEVECVGEVALCVGRVISFSTLLILITLTGTTYLPHFAVISSLAIIPALTITLPKHSKS